MKRNYKKLSVNLSVVLFISISDRGRDLKNMDKLKSSLLAIVSGICRAAHNHMYYYSSLIINIPIIGHIIGVTDGTLIF